MTQVAQAPSLQTFEPAPLTFTSRLVSGLLSIKPLANFAKNRARKMMIERAEGLGVYWVKEADALRSRGSGSPFSSDWETDLANLRDDNLTYPDYYLKPFHAYEEGNLGWDPAMESEVAAKAVHARLWPEETSEGDVKLRNSYIEVLKAELPQPPQKIVDGGCSVGLSTFSLQAAFPEAQITGVELSPYFLAIAQYRDNQSRDNQFQDNQSRDNQRPNPVITWKHAAAESTGLPAQSADLVSFSLVFHELPRTAAVEIVAEAYRLLKPGGHLAIMDMNPKSEAYERMPPYILTLLKSTEPFLDDYFSFDLAGAIAATGFESPSVSRNTTRHRTIVAKKLS